MSTRTDLRQTKYVGSIDQLTTTQITEGDNIVKSINDDLTALLRLSANDPASLVVNVGGSDLLNAESTRRRAIPHIGTAYVQFSSGTVTFPAASGGNITTSTGGSTILTVASGNFAAVLIYLDSAGNLNTIPGTDAATASAAIANLPPSPDETLAAGFVVVENVGGVIQNILQSNIRQFGTGTGGGSSGNVTSVETALRDYNNFAQTKYLDPNIFRQQKSTKVDAASTGSFDLVKNAFKLASIGQTFVSTNLANAEFLAEGVDLTDVHLYLHWLQDSIDPAATYEVSRDGGTNWQALTVSRVGTQSNAFRGYKVFNDEPVQQNLVTVAASGAGDTLNAVANQQLSSRFTLSTTSVIRSLDLQLNRATSASVGNFFVQIVRDNAGVPSTALADLVAESNAVSISSLSTGDITVTLNLPTTVLVAGDYHIVLRTDADYKAGTMNLAWRSAASGTLGATFDGAAWTGSASTKAQTIKGRAHDLRVRVTASAANVFIEGMGVYFPSDDGLVRPNGSKNVQRFYFSGNENRTNFQLTWTPDPDLLDIFDPYRGQIYTIEPGVAQIQGNTVVFASGTFDLPNEDVVLIFRQVKGIAIDNSDSNAAKNSEQDQNLIDVGSQIEELDFVSISKIAVPFTDLVNRAPIVDLNQDLNTCIGINRIQTQQIARIQNEFGPNGEPVFRAVNDRFDQVRFVGSGWRNLNDGDGVRPFTEVLNDYVEITFYGTGLNWLGSSATGAKDIRSSVDGGAYSVATIRPTVSGVIAQRNYSSNVCFPVYSNLSVGLHTVRIKLNDVGGANSLDLNGFEILNETTNLRVRPGLQLVKGKARTLSAESAQAFNLGFEVGTLGTRGGRVVVYQKADGTIAKAVTPTDTTQLNLASADHANEEVARVYNFREFGAGRTDDFSRLSGLGAGNYAFTLDDGTTTLVMSTGASGGIGFSNPREAIQASGAVGNFISITFVGTGLDIVGVGDGTSKNYDVEVDGSAIGTLVLNAGIAARNLRVVSGLPYGSHTVRFVNSGAAFGIADFIVYQPKTPSVPTGAKAIAAYNVMANFAENTTPGVDTIATGVLRKSCSREFVYVNGTGGTTDFNMSLDTADPGGFRSSSDRLNSYYEYTFFGTGFEMRTTAQSDRSQNTQVSLQSLSTGGSLQNLTTTNFPTITHSVYGTGVTFNAATGIFDQRDAAVTRGIGLRISDLPLGLYKVRFNNGTAGEFMTISTFDVITPVHSQKSNLYAAAQNTLAIGSQAIEDLRKIKALEQVVDQKSVSQAFGVAASPSTSSTAYVPLPDLSVTHNTKSGRLKVSWSFAGQTVTNGARLVIYLNGQAVGPELSFNSGAGAINSGSAFINAPIGTNKIDLYWKMLGAGSVTALVRERVLTVEEA